MLTFGQWCSTPLKIITNLYKVYFRSQILESDCQAILEHTCVAVSLAIGQHCHVLDHINILELGDTGTI